MPVGPARTRTLSSISAVYREHAAQASSQLGKWWYTVPTLTPARSAICGMERGVDSLFRVQPLRGLDDAPARLIRGLRAAFQPVRLGDMKPRILVEYYSLNIFFDKCQKGKKRGPREQPRVR